MSRGLLMMRCLFAMGALAALAGCSAEVASVPETVEAQTAQLERVAAVHAQARPRVWGVAKADPYANEDVRGMHLTMQTIMVEDYSAAHDIVPMQFWRTELACPDHHEPVECACEFSAKGFTWAFHSDGACHCRTWAQGTGTIHTSATCDVAQ